MEEIQELMIVLIYIFLAAACNAVMDTLTHHWSTSIFSKFGNSYSWWGDTACTWVRKYKYGLAIMERKKLFWKINVPVQATDAWHFFKMLMIILIACAVTCAYYMGPPVTITWIYPSTTTQAVVNLLLNFTLIGCVWNGAFSLFYNYLLKR